MRTVSVLLISAMLFVAACGGDETPAPTEAPTETPTPAVVQDAVPDTPTAEASTAMTETAEMTDTMAMTDTVAVTDTAAMTDTAGMTETTDMTTTGEMTATDGMTAVAILQDTEGNAVGQATFTESADGVLVQVEVQGLTVAEAGAHGIHIHTTGACTPDFQAAGGHFNPNGAQHGLENPSGPHAGDLPNMEIDADGNGAYEATAALVTLGAGENSLFDADGSALVIHAGPDDMVTDPAGDSGDRIACGVVEQQ